MRASSQMPRDVARVVLTVVATALTLSATVRTVQASIGAGVLSVFVPTVDVLAQTVRPSSPLRHAGNIAPAFAAALAPGAPRLPRSRTTGAHVVQTLRARMFLGVVASGLFALLLAAGWWLLGFARRSSRTRGRPRVGVLVLGPPAVAQGRHLLRGVVMKAIHIDTGGLDTTSDASLLEAVLRMLAGVADVVAVRSLGLVSVLYDERKITPRTILREIRATGFDARFWRPGKVQHRPAVLGSSSSSEPGASVAGGRMG